MAQQGAFGLRWLGVTKSGAPGYTSEYGKTSTDAIAIFMNDVVMKTAASVPSPSGGNPAPGCQSAAHGTAGTGLWLGVSLNYAPANQASMHYVIDDPTAIFVTQTDSAAAETTAAIVGDNANLNVSAAGNALTRMSGMTLNSASITTLAGKDVRILGLWDNPVMNPDNAPYPIVEVEIVLHQYAGQSVGV
jgi:hypothetical protein